MRINKSIKISFIAIGLGVLLAAGIVFYMFNQPKRDVQASKTDYRYKASEIVNEYLTDASKANEKYLDEEGESKILEISGEVAAISEDFNKLKIVLLQSKSDKAGVSCTFTQESDDEVNLLKLGDQISIKGVIRSGANYDIDLELYENLILSNCKIIK